MLTDFECSVAVHGMSRKVWVSSLTIHVNNGV